MAVLDKSPARVRIVEVGPRDGLQNEARAVPTALKLRFIDALADAGHRHIEVGSFVRPDRVPQLADAEALFRGLRRRDGVVYTALVPNRRGLERALAAGVESIAVFTAASEAFSAKNAGASIAESIDAIRAVASEAQAAGLRIRAYVSCAFVCPYEGTIAPERVLRVLGELRALGIAAISIGDTLGAADPRGVDRLLEAIAARCPAPRSAGAPLAGLALHLHDTYGRALANAVVGLAHGIEEFDASAGGLGGCPFAPGAKGNLDTGTLVSMLAAMGIETGIDLDAHERAAKLIRGALASPGDQ
jgi:hydroxymethylglutaryl-CoA lyase